MLERKSEIAEVEAVIGLLMTPVHCVVCDTYIGRILDGFAAGDPLWCEVCILVLNPEIL